MADIAAPAPRGNTLLIALLLGAGGYAAYRYVYVPYRFRQQLAQQAAAQGLPTRDYLQRIGSAACQAYGAAQGIPPQVSGGICGELASAAAEVARNLPEILQGAGRGVGALGKGAGEGIVAIGKGFVDANFYPVEKGGGLIKDGTAAIYGGAKTVVQDAVDGVKYVANNVLNPVQVTKNIFGWGKGVNCSTAQQPANAAWCRSQYGMASAPGSDAWARANGQAIVLTGAGSS